MREKEITKYDIFLNAVWDFLFFVSLGTFGFFMIVYHILNMDLEITYIFMAMIVLAMLYIIYTSATVNARRNELRRYTGKRYFKQ